MENSEEIQTGIYYNGLMKHDGGKSLLEAIAVLINLQRYELAQIISEGLEEGRFGRQRRKLKTIVCRHAAKVFNCDFKNLRSETYPSRKKVINDRTRINAAKECTIWLLLETGAKAYLWQLK